MSLRLTFLMSVLVGGVAAAQTPVTIDSTDQRVAPTDVELLLAGRVPGAAVTRVSAAFGGRPEVVLRADAVVSLEEPLYIIDGVVATHGATLLDPADIETVEVMRGAAAASLYGSRAGAGVIVITTRGGRRGSRPVFEFRSEGGVGTVAKGLDPAANTMLLTDGSGQRFCVAAPGAPSCDASIDWAAELARINNLPGDTTATAAQFPVSPLGIPAAALANTYQATPWPGRTYRPADQVIRSSLLSLSEFSGAGTVAGVGVFGSASRLSEGGALETVDGYRRYTGRLDLAFAPWRAVSIQLRNSFARATDAGRRSYEGATFRLALTPAASDLLARDTLGRRYLRTNLYAPSDQNPFDALELLVDDAAQTRLGNALAVRYALGGHVTLDGDIGRDQVVFDRRVMIKARGSETFSDSPLNQAARATSLAAGVGATARWAPMRGIAATTQFRLRLERDDERSAWGDGLSTESYRTRSAGILGATSVVAWSRYLLDASIRSDQLHWQDTRIPSARSWHVGAGWRISEEPWWFGGALLDRFAIRAARGSIDGGLPDLPHLYEKSMPASPGISLPPNGVGRSETEFGVETRWMHGLEILAVHRSAMTDAWLLVPLPAEQGFGSAWRNAGGIADRGWELSALLPLVRRADASWSWRLAYDRARVTFARLDVPPFTYGAQGEAVFLARVGEPYGAMYGRRFATSCAELPAAFIAQCGDGLPFERNNDGLVVWTGSFTWRDGITQNQWGQRLAPAQAPWGVGLGWGAPIIVRDSVCETTPGPNCSALQAPLGSVLPDWRFSISTTARWHRVTLFALLDGAIGGRTWNRTRHWTYGQFASPEQDQHGLSVEQAKPVGYYWRAGPGDGFTGYGGLYDVLFANSYFVESTSYARLRELALSWDLGRVAGFGDWTLGLTGRNVLTFTRYRGLDPELPLAPMQQFGADDYDHFPGLRTLGVSIGVRF